MHFGKKQTKPALNLPRPGYQQPETLEPRCLLSASVVNDAQPPVALPPAVVAAAGQGDGGNSTGQSNGLTASASNGAGQTIAIICSGGDSNVAADLAIFDARFGLPAPPSLTVVDQSGGSASAIATGADWKVSRSVEWAHAMAPDASILLVQANDASPANLQAAVDYASSVPGVYVVSLSSESFDGANSSTPASDAQSGDASHSGAFVPHAAAAGSDSPSDMEPLHAGFLVRTLSDPPSEGWYPPPAGEPAGTRTATDLSAAYPMAGPTGAASGIVIDAPRFVRNAQDVAPDISNSISQSASVSPSASAAPGSSAPAAAPAQLPAVFSNTVIRPSAASFSAPRSERIELSSLVTHLQPTSALAVVGGWMGEADRSLGAWLSGGGMSSLVADVTTLGIADVDLGGADAAGSEIAAPAVISPSAALATVLAAPLIAAPANILYRFANFDPVATFSDAMAEFSRESATLAPLHPDQGSRRAWMITGIVLTADVLLATRWYLNRRKKKEDEAALAAGLEQLMNPESPQAGYLPTGL